jgi:hypothetical protein
MARISRMLETEMFSLLLAWIMFIRSNFGSRTDFIISSWKAFGIKILSLSYLASSFSSGDFSSLKAFSRLVIEVILACGIKGF